MKAEFLENVKDALELENHDIALSDRFRDLPKWDSLAFLSLISMIDDEYDVVIDGKAFEKLHTLEDVLNEIEARKN
jgi:acyl carrier protein